MGFPRQLNEEKIVQREKDQWQQLFSPLHILGTGLPLDVRFANTPAPRSWWLVVFRDTEDFNCYEVPR